MVLVHQIKGASVVEFTRLAASQLLVVQEGRVWTQLGEEMEQMCIMWECIVRGNQSDLWTGRFQCLINSVLSHKYCASLTYLCDNSVFVCITGHHLD